MLKIQQWIVFFLLFAVSASCFALPFNIYPANGISLPTFVQAGQTTPAYYTLTNNANKTLNNNFIKYLPPNVAQVTTDAAIPNICGATFNLAPNGIVGDTCTLELVVSGSVDANDPDPHHHLFACLYGGVLCAGTSFPLNVIQVGLLTAIVVTPAVPAIAVGQTIQFTARAVFSDGTSQDVSALANWVSSNTGVATVNSTGLATSVSTGSTTITASFEGITGGTLLTVDNLAIVAGNYTNSSSASFPILIQSSDGGTSWAYAVDSSTSSVLPTASSAFAINGASCAGALCVSVGSYSDGTNTNIYAFQTQDAGTSYATAISATTSVTPTNYVSGSLSGVSCQGTDCLVAGSYNSLTTQLPYAALSTNSGASYSLVVDSSTPTLPTDFASAGTFSNASCVSTLCLASGSYVSTTGGTQFPWLAESVLPAGAWFYPITSTTAATITDYSGTGVFNASDCNGVNCVAVGSYVSSTGGINEAPLIAQGTNTGAGWTYEVTSAQNPADYVAIGTTNLTGAACGTSACIAVGEYSSVVSGDTQEVPLIYQSISGGTWTIVASNTIGVGPSLPTNFNASLVSAGCSGTLCVAAGTYLDALSGNTLPLILVSNNGGSTFTVATNPTSPEGLTVVTVGATSCQGTFCTVAANYSDGTNNQPLIIQTTNNGTTFTYPVSAGTPTEPSDAVNVFFTASSISMLANQLTHKDFDHAKQLKNRLKQY
jgi:hypothetical protein